MNRIKEKCLNRTLKKSHRKTEYKISRRHKYDRFDIISMRKILYSFFAENTPPTLSSVLGNVNEDSELPEFKRINLMKVSREGDTLEQKSWGAVGGWGGRDLRPSESAILSAILCSHYTLHVTLTCSWRHTLNFYFTVAFKPINTGLEAKDYTDWAILLSITCSIPKRVYKPSRAARSVSCYYSAIYSLLCRYQSSHHHPGLF